MLFVVDVKKKKNNNNESNNTAIAVSHVSICPDKESLWLEGIRVHPDYRRSKVATSLIKRMLQYGKSQGAKEASAIVAVDNVISQHMFKKNGFEVISRWIYYNSNYKMSQDRGEINARIALPRDIDKVWNYLKKSKIYKFSGKRYVNAWRWYRFNDKTLVDFVKEQRLIITGDSVINGIAVVNKNNYTNINMRIDALQIVYLDSTLKSSLLDLVFFVRNSYLAAINPTYYNPTFRPSNRLEVIACKTEQISSVMKNFHTKKSEQFLLYCRKI